MHFVLVFENLHDAIYFVAFKYARDYKNYCYHDNTDLYVVSNFFRTLNYSRC